MSLALRAAGPEDAAALGAMWARLREAAGDPSVDPEAMAARMARRLAAGYRAAYLEEAGARVGYASWRPEPEDERMYLAHLYIEAAARGRGLGRAAVDLLRREAFPPGVAIKLHVSRNNTAGAAFWRALGFEATTWRFQRDPEG